MGDFINQSVLARKRAHKRYLEEFAAVRARKKLGPSCTFLTDEIIKLIELERKNLAARKCREGK